MIKAIFPPLDKSIKEVDILEYIDDNIEMPNKGSAPWRALGAKVHNSFSELPFEIKKSGGIIRLDEDFRVSN